MTHRSVAWLTGVALVVTGGVVVLLDDPDRGCVRTEQVVTVDQEGAVYRHAVDAIRAGKSRVLHKGVPGETSKRNREAWHRAQGAKWPTKPGFDRDEYPPALSLEGGAATDLRYVPSAENQAQGRELGKQTRRYCTGQAFRYVDIPGR